MNDNIYFCDWKNINDIDIEKYRLLCDGKICTVQIPPFHCILCNEEDFPPPKHFLNPHLKQSHFNRAHCVKFENNAFLSCRYNNHTMSKLKRKIGHFHWPICKKTVRQKGNHFRSKHQTLHCMPSVVCADKALGIYMVPKSKSGVLRPIHVQKCFRKPDQSKLFCENNFCMNFIGICGKSGLGY